MLPELVVVYPCPVSIYMFDIVKKCNISPPAQDQVAGERYRTNGPLADLYDIGLRNSDSKFQTSIALLFVNKIASVGMHCLGWNKRSILVPTLFDFAVLLFAHLPQTLPCSSIEEARRCCVSKGIDN